jgi:transposase
MPRAGPKKMLRYSLDFKRKAVKLTQVPGMEVQTVAKALDIHPFMLSRWRREAREGTLRGVESTASPKMPPLREIKRLQQLEREHALLKQEHELLKKAIRFCSTRRQTSSRSSTTTGAASR